MPPVTECPGDIRRTASLGETSLPVTWPNPTATDNSGFVNVGSTHLPGQFFPIGETRVTYTFQDPSNNVERCSFLIIVEQGKYTLNSLYSRLAILSVPSLPYPPDW